MDDSLTTTPPQVENTSPEPSKSRRSRKSFLLVSLAIPVVLLFLSIPAVFALGVTAGYFLWGGDERRTQSSGDTQNVTRYDVPIDDDPILGSKNAPITLIEFSDYECPYCKRWHSQVFNQLMDEYPGKIRFVYRDFPLTSIHPNATPAAEAAGCAFDQDKFWEFNDMLFNGQLGLSPDAYVAYAQELGLDMEKFQECVTSRQYQEEVQADLEWATNLGIRSTPTFFLNGIPIVGAQPFEVFKEVVEKELAGEFSK